MIKLIVRIVVCLFIFSVNIFAQYCIPDVATVEAEVGIGHVALSNLDYASAMEEGYQDYSALTDTAMVVLTSMYNLEITAGVSSSYKAGIISVWIDWNQDQDFDDIYEDVSVNFNLSAFPEEMLNIAVSIPSTASLGYTKMRISCSMGSGSEPVNCGTQAEGDIEDYVLNVIDIPMIYKSASAYHPLTNCLYPKAKSKKILGINVVTEGGMDSLSATQIVIDFNGTTRLNDIKNITLWYAASDSNPMQYIGITAFEQYRKQFGSSIISTATNQLVFEDSQKLIPGNNYFFLTVDIDSSAVVTDIIDVSCTEIIINGNSKTPIISNPLGNHTIDFQANHPYSKELNNWHFGAYTGLDFNCGTPSIINDSWLNQYEGCASISDKDGNVQFYTNGISTWDRLGGIMPNGTGLFGNISSSQSALIFPAPLSDSLFYLFTVSSREVLGTSDDRGLNYSIINMALNEGFGDITNEKNIGLLNSSFEKLTAAKHCNGRDIWVVAIAYPTGSFHSYLVSENGISNSYESITNSLPVFSNGRQVQGPMKISPDGKYIAMGFGDNSYNYAHIYTFDNSNGAVKYFCQLPVNALSRATGVTFSPDSKKLYIADEVYGIFQYDFSSPDTQSILNSRQLIGPSAFVYQMQIGPDGKIYIAQNGTFFIDVIQNPNASDSAACGYIDNYIGTGLPRYCQIGMPNFPDYYFHEFIDSTSIHLANAAISDTVGCEGDFIFMNLNADYSYDFINTTNVQINAANELMISNISDKIYIVAVSNNRCFMDTIYFTINSYQCDSTEDSNPEKEIPFFIPNIFSPNNDNQNDYLMVKGNENNFIALQIFDKFGNKVFVTTDMNISWNGQYKNQEAKDGIYVYELKFKDSNNSSRAYMGNIALIK